MDMKTWDVSELLNSSQPISEQAFSELIKYVRSSARIREHFVQNLNKETNQHSTALANDAVRSLKTAQAYYAIGDFRSAISWLEKSGNSTQHCYLKACSYRSLKQYDAALEQFEAAEGKGWDSFEAAMAITDCRRRKGDISGAEQQLKRVSRVGEIRAEYHYQLGRLRELKGQHQEAIESYQRSVELDNRHTEALFHLAFACDLYGDEKLAIRYYEQCVESGSIHVSALLNLAVLYEQDEQYENALRCVSRILKAYPNHQRAQMDRKDIEASGVMYFDEEQERRLDRRNQVLEIPISDFELSVRSRNCLKKMNIRYLGDLLRVTESELLAYKNFGETSLTEIKAILNQKGLRLGQMLEDRGAAYSGEHPVEEAPAEDNQLLSQPVSELELSVRARKCLQRLNINIIGDLTNCTEAELLGCKNFGQTSLLEIKQRLKERNLSLRQLD